MSVISGGDSKRIARPTLCRAELFASTRQEMDVIVWSQVGLDNNVKIDHRKFVVLNHNKKEPAVVGQNLTRRLGGQCKEDMGRFRHMNGNIFSSFV